MKVFGWQHPRSLLPVAGNTRQSMILLQDLTFQELETNSDCFSQKQGLSNYPPGNYISYPTLGSSEKTSTQTCRTKKGITVTSQTRVLRGGSNLMPWSMIPVFSRMPVISMIKIFY